MKKFLTVPEVTDYLVHNKITFIVEAVAEQVALYNQGVRDGRIADWIFHTAFELAETT